jgi:hypothetical protein
VIGPASALLVESNPDDGKFLADALRAQGMQVDEANPPSAPLDAKDLRNYAPWCSPMCPRLLSRKSR